MPILFLFFFFLSYGSLYAQVTGLDDGWPYENSALIWQGFTQEWSYNHRLNRLGDYIASQSIQQDTLMARIHHNASTGTGTDAGPYGSFYSYIAVNDVHFTTGDTTFLISGTEGQMSTQSFVIRGHLAAHLKKKNSTPYYSMVLTSVLPAKPIR